VIKSKQFILVAAAAAMLHTAGVALAQDSLEGLLQQVQAARATEQQTFQQRAEQYNAAPADQQAKMLADAQAGREALSAESDKLSARFSANELVINEADKRLREKSAALGLQEVFGLARQVAGDTASILQQSMISTQFPAKAGELNRDDYLRSFAAAQKAPTQADLEQMWMELYGEMTQSGSVAKYTTKVVQPGGAPVDAEVIRIGPFTAISEGKYLNYLPELKAFSVYPRQPPSEFMATAKDLSAATNGNPTAVVDGSRGVLMSLYVERPSWGSRIEHGESINYVILAVGGIAFLCFLVQLGFLLLVRSKVSSQLRNLTKPTADNALGRVLLAFKGDGNNIEQDADVAELRIAEAVFREVPKLERFQPMLRLAVAAGPLLGLIGTVLGMIMTFQSITESGSSDPKLMADGIGAAMIATVLGLGIAIPLLFANALLTSLSKGITQVIEEQSAGMLAESIERTRRG
jgi:biopolymer transport protein ExbB